MNLQQNIFYSEFQSSKERYDHMQDLQMIKENDRAQISFFDYTPSSKQISQFSAEFPSQKAAQDFCQEFFS